MGAATSAIQRNNEPGSTNLKVVDLHGDILLDIVLRRNVLEETNVLLNRHYDALRASGVKVQVLPIYVDRPYQPESSLRVALSQIASLYHELREGKGEFRMITNATELDQVLESEAIGVILAFEGGEPLGRDIDLLSVFYELGLRMVGLTWNRANLLAQGIVEDTGAGLSTLGRELVSELNRTGIMLDLTHLSATSFFDALKYSTGPVLASHSNASSVWENPRNLTDDQIKAIAERDGIIGLNFLPEFVGTREVINRLVDHVDHIASLVGLQFVALGPDFIDFLKFRAQGRESAQYDWVANELEEAAYEPSARLLPGFHKALLARGFSEEDARSVMYGNATDFLRKNL